MKKKKDVNEELNGQPDEMESNQEFKQEINEEDTSIEIEGKPAADDKSEDLKTAIQKISELEDKVKQLQDSLLRKAAEFENYKRRTENDQLNLLKYAAEPIIKNILIVYDDMERSISHINDNNNFDSLKKGMELVFEKFTKILNSQGVKKIDAMGKPFDVNFHEALMQQPVNSAPPNTVIQIVEEGYMYKDKVIRHSKVIVSSEAEDQAQNNSGSNKTAGTDSNLEG
ncbi:MAG TPA: nucleotide exchange factor GrpE [Melioribacteraceae bacterium]|mgnify:CR=1 FL=1|nr:nucleotide exchange factor GrpE [Melioribacteraceae bacterium]